MSGSHNHCEIRIENLRVPHENILGRLGGGHELGQARLGPARLAHCMRWLGQIETALEMMIDRAQKRYSHGSLLSEKQAIQWMIAESGLELYAAKLMVLTAPEQVANALRIGYKPTSAKRRLVGGAPSLYSTVLNGSPAMVVALDDRVVAVVVLDLRDGRIATVRGMANPARFERLSRIWQPSRDGSLVLDSW